MAGLDRLAVFLLHQEQDLEPLLRVVEPAQVLDQVADDIRLLEQRHEHRVDGELVVGHPRGRNPAITLPGGARPHQRGHELEQDGKHEGAVDRDDQRDEQSTRIEQRSDRQRSGEQLQREPLPERQASSRTQQRIPVREPEGCVAADVAAEDAPERDLDVPVGRGQELDRADAGRQTLGAGREDAPGQLSTRRLGGRHLQGRADQPERDPALAHHQAALDLACDLSIRRVIDEIDEVAAPEIGQHLVEPLAPHQPGREQNPPQPHARPLLRLQRPAKLELRDKATSDQRFAERQRRLG